MTPELRAYIVRNARRYGAEDAEDVAQTVMMDMLGKPFLADPGNQPQLLSRIRQRTLTQLRTARRRRHYEGMAALETYPESTDEASDAMAGDW